MGLSNKHFDDLDDFSAFEEKLDCSDESESPENGPSSALAWRKALIEKAVGNVRKAMEVKTDIKSAYKVGQLLFDDEAHKFGRVVESRPGFLSLNLLGGGKIVKEDINRLEFVRKNRADLTLQEMADHLKLTEVQIIGLLNQLETENETETKAASKPANKLKISTPISAPAKASVMKKAPAPTIKIAAKSTAKLPVKVAAKKNAPAKKAKLSLSSVSKEHSVSFAKLLPKGATTDPIRDPNGYIQQNFLMMSNKELAVATGLSEHTVRRKLGEWGLKRKDFVNKA